MKRKIELLAPGGDVDCIKAAIVAGADAVYCGLDRFNARNKATNIKIADLPGILHLAHQNNCRIFVTLNIIIVESEISALISLLNKLVNTKIDGVIIQDLGVFYLVRKYFKDLKVHASTQLTTHNEGQIRFLNKLAATRVNLSRELTIHEIDHLSSIAHTKNILTEVFVHGSYCLGFSGVCYMSSVAAGKSGNRGRCSQPCRNQYVTTPAGKDFPLNLKDNSAYCDLDKLYDAGVDALKIEGRVKKSDYVYTVVDIWRKQIDNYCNNNTLCKDKSGLLNVFNRDFSNGYLIGDINKNLFIDNPRDNTIKNFTGIDSDSPNKKLLKEKVDYYKSKTDSSTQVRNRIQELYTGKIPITLNVSGKCGAPLEISVKTPDKSFVVLSKMNLVQARAQNIDQVVSKNKDKNVPCLNYNDFLQRFKIINNTKYSLHCLKIDDLQSDLFLPYKELTSMKNKIVSLLHGTQKLVAPIEVPVLEKKIPLKNKPDLAVLISSENDVCLGDETSANIFFQLPNCCSNDQSEFIDLFRKNRRLLPWFPAVLIGKDYTAAVDILHRAQSECIVTNNTGIAYEAYKNRIPWVAGPYLNSVNSFSLLCLKEHFNCSGAFISNEISRKQIKRISSPENFKLFYSIYHPILLLMSRQCLFHQTIGCEKDSVNEECLRQCNRDTLITNLDTVSHYIKKTKGNYHCIYNRYNFLNTDIITDFPNIFSSFLIDLRDIQTETKVAVDKRKVIKIFEEILAGKADSLNEVNQAIHPSTNVQYEQGI